MTTLDLHDFPIKLRSLEGDNLTYCSSDPRRYSSY